MKNFTKQTAYTLSAVILLAIFLGLPHVTRAASEYTLLEPIAGYKAGETVPDFAAYLQKIFVYLIRVGGILGVVMLVIAGVEYTASGVSESRKDDAKKRINNVALGLLGALTAYFVLNLINPALVNFSLKIDPIDYKSTNTSTGTGNPFGGLGSQPSAVTGSNTNITAEDTGEENAKIRDDIGAFGVTVWSASDVPCPTGVSFNTYKKTHSRGCITLAGFKDNTINGIKALRAKCGCALQINGGTELGHKDSGHVGGTVVDFQRTDQLTAYVMANKTALKPKGTNQTFDIYTVENMQFQDETAKGHWHVTFK